MAGARKLFLLSVSTSLLWLALFPQDHASANPREIEKLRKYYREHNLDFFGSLIADQNDFIQDEKKKAKLELLADDARSRALAQLENLLRSAGPDLRPELLLRKANLLADRSRTASYFQGNPFKTSRLKEPKIYLSESIKTFMLLEKQYPSHPRMDTILFSIGYNYSELKDFDRAMAYYNHVVKRFPQSSLVGDARLAIADILFDKRNFNGAIAELREIVKAEQAAGGEGRLKNFALYKMGWAYYNLGDLDSGLNALERVVDGVNQAGVQRARLELRKEALHDIVTFYADRPEKSIPGGAATNASTYFERVGKPSSAVAAEHAASRAKRIEALKEKHAPIPDEDRDEFQITEAQEMLLRLATVYRDQGKHEQSMVVAADILRTLGRHPKAPPFYRLRAEAAEKLHRRDLVLRELEALAKAVKDELPPVSETKSGLPRFAAQDMDAFFKKIPLVSLDVAPPSFELPKKATAPELTDPYQISLAKVSLESLREFATFFHGEWNKTKSHEAAQHALSAYDTGLTALLDPWRGADLKTCMDLRFQRAHLLLALEDWDRAARDYEWLAGHLPPERAKERDEALAGEIGARESMVKSLGGTSSGKTIDKSLFDRLLNVYDRHLSIHLLDTKGEARVISAKILNASARLAKQLKREDAAFDRLVYYSKFLFSEKDGEAAVRDVLVTLERASRWTELRDYSALILKQGHFAKSAVQPELVHSNEYAILRILEELEKAKDWKNATREFSEFAQTHPQSKFASQALLKAAVAAIELKDNKMAILKLEKATSAPDKSVQSQAWLALEPYYRRAFQWPKLLVLYSRVNALQNVKEIQKLQAATFMQSAPLTLPEDAAWEELLSKQTKIESEAKEFAALRFTKTNRNPEQNFKRKTDQHAKLVAAVERVAKTTARNFKGIAAAWANIVKGELLIELAETLETAALPAVLKTATEADRKSYQDILSAQSKDVHEKAKQLAQDVADGIGQLDIPIDLEERLNTLLAKVGDPRRFKRADFAKIWAERPGREEEARAISGTSQGSKTSQPNLGKIADLGLDVLDSDGEKSERATLELTRAYNDMGEPGFAYAVAQPLATKGGFQAESFRIRFGIDLARAPQVKTAMRIPKLTPRLRWDLARWIAAYQASADKVSGLTPQERDWFKSALTELLRPVQVPVSGK